MPENIFDVNFDRHHISNDESQYKDISSAQI